MVLYTHIPLSVNFNGYIEMSEDDDALFWKESSDPDPKSRSENAGQAPHAGKAPLAMEAYDSGSAHAYACQSTPKPPSMTICTLLHQL